MANRKMRRKTKERTVNDEYSQSTKSMLITLGVVLVVFGLFYLMTVVINNKNRKLNIKDPVLEEATIQYSEILGDDTFVMGQNEYYVLFYDFDSPEAAYYDYLFNQYANGEDQYIYKVDLGSGFNKKYVSEETNKKAKKAGDLKVKEATLIKIKKGKNVEYTEGSKDTIAKILVK